MSQFVCKVGTEAGDIRELSFQADNEGSLRGELREKGYHIFWVKKRLRLGSVGSLVKPGRRERIKQAEFTLFNQELAALLRAGLPLLQSLEIMLERMKNPLFKRVLSEIRTKVKSGVALSDAFRGYGDLFPRIYAASLVAGEKSGSLETVLQRYVLYAKLTQGTRNKVISAMVYPSFLLVTLVLAAGFLLLWVVPKFAGFFDSFGGELPLLTRVLLGVAGTMQDHFLIIVAVLIGLAVFLYGWSRAEASKMLVSHWQLKIPFLGPILHLFSTSQLTRSLGTLLAGGIPLVQAVEISGDAIGNRFLGSLLRPVADRVREGKSFASMLENTNQFSNLTIEMVKVGENTGGLAEMLTNVADFADEEIENRLNLMLSMLTPIVLLVMGLLVAIILLAIYLPLFSLAGAAH